MDFKHRSQIRICFVGESFVNGTGDPDRICVDANKKGYDITYYNLGVRGETSLQLKERWLQEVSCRLPKEYDCRVVFSFGVNDTVLENGTPKIALINSIINGRDILNEAKQKYQVLMISPPPTLDREHNERIAYLSKHFARFCRGLNVPYLDVFSILEKSNIWMDEVRNYDGAHPRARGYQEFAEIVQKWDAWLKWFPSISG
jgi:lysophospholipase L1-like esterase